MQWHERDGVRWLEADLPGARAAFSTRLGGVSEEPYASLNVAVKTGDELDHVRENRHRLAAALGRNPADVVMGRQIHGAELRWHDRRQEPRVYADAVKSPEEVDAHATGQCGAGAAGDGRRLPPDRARRHRGRGDGPRRLARARRRDRRDAARAGRGRGGRDRARDRSLLLRGGGGGAGGVRRARRGRRRPHARPARGRAAAARARRGRRRSRPPTSAPAATRSSSSPTAATASGPGARRGWSGDMA